MSLETSPSILCIEVDCIGALKDDALCKLMTMFRKCKASLKDGDRLENLSWRLWYLVVGRNMNLCGTAKQQHPVRANSERMPLRTDMQESVHSHDDRADLSLKRRLLNKPVLTRDHVAVGKHISHIIFDLENYVRVPSKTSIQEASSRTQSVLVAPLLPPHPTHTDLSGSTQTDAITRGFEHETLYRSKRKTRLFKVASSHHPRFVINQSAKAQEARKALLHRRSLRRDLAGASVAAEFGSDTASDFKTTDDELNTSSICAYVDRSNAGMGIFDGREEGAEKWRQQPNVFAKLPEQSYRDVKHQRPSLLSQLLSVDIGDISASRDRFTPNPFSRATSYPIHEHATPGLANSRGTPATPVPVKVSVQAVPGLGSGDTRRHARYGPRAPPPDQELEDDSDSGGENTDNHIQVSRSMAERKLAGLARRNDTRQSHHGHAPADPPVGTSGNADTSVIIPIQRHPIPPAAIPMSPQTTRTRMVAMEFPGSLIQALSWERFVNHRGPRPALSTYGKRA